MKNCRSKRKCKTSRRKHKKSRRFGNKGGLLDIMGNFRPPAQMSYAQSYTGLSPDQMARHMANIPPSLRDGFYTYI